MITNFYEEIKSYIWMYWDNEKHSFFGKGATYKLGRCEYHPKTIIPTKKYLNNKKDEKFHTSVLCCRHRMKNENGVRPKDGDLVEVVPRPPRAYDHLLNMRWWIGSTILTAFTIYLYLPSWLKLGTLNYQMFNIVKEKSVTFPVEQALPFSFTMQFEENSIVEAMRAGEPTKFSKFPDYWYADDDWKHTTGH